MDNSITELKKSLEREQAAKLICSHLNHFVELKSTLITILDHLMKLTGIEAVGIRLQDGCDYPYFVYNGFPESFIEQENSLCSRDNQGNCIPDPDGKGHLLDCMCGNIIRGNTDPDQSFFTPKGSFWSNRTTELLSSSTEEDRQGTTRNNCNASGYESVVLIPIKIGEDRIGLIQLNDHRKDMFNGELIEFLEMIGEQVGMAVQNSLTYSRLKEAMEELKVLRGIIPMCCNCKKIRDDSGFWHQVESYIERHSNAEFTHGICPECSQALYPGILTDKPPAK